MEAFKIEKMGVSLIRCPSRNGERKGKQFDPQILEIFLKEKIYDFSKEI